MLGHLSREAILIAQITWKHMCITQQQKKDAERVERKVPTPHPQKTPKCTHQSQTKHTQKGRTPDGLKTLRGTNHTHPVNPQRTQFTHTHSTCDSIQLQA